MSFLERWVVRGVIGWFKPSVVRVLLLVCLIIGTTIFLSLPRTDASALSQNDSQYPPREWFYRRHLTSMVNDTCRIASSTKRVIVDETGSVCKFVELSAQSCCVRPHAQKYVCDSCNERHCCTLFEHCISCCLAPDHMAIRSEVYSSLSPSQKRVLTLASDQFDYCELKCRSDSSSVHHENKFRDPSLIHCFGKDVADVKHKHEK
eukprot:m.17904 g.17904  ORF g.17904 m.17904 type:complete len:205 (-) comp8211_c0_seq1:125-739(-)